MVISICLIKFRETYESKYEYGMCIGYINPVDCEGCIRPSKYFSLNIDSSDLKFFKYKDMFEILYINSFYL